jgi:hypothetical protein
MQLEPGADGQALPHRSCLGGRMSSRPVQNNARTLKFAQALGSGFAYDDRTMTEH